MFIFKTINLILTFTGHLGRGRMVAGFTTTYAISDYPVHGKMYSIQHYVIKFVSNLCQVGNVFRFPQPIKLTAMI